MRNVVSIGLAASLLGASLGAKPCFANGGEFSPKSVLVNSVTQINPPEIYANNDVRNAKTTKNEQPVDGQENQNLLKKGIALLGIAIPTVIILTVKCIFNKANDYIEKVILFGSPSTGKSTFVNKVAGTDFETGEAFGVTKGITCVNGSVLGKPVQFCDTPGLHFNVTNSEEAAGIAAAKKFLPNADKVLAMFNSKIPLNKQSMDEIITALNNSKNINPKQNIIGVLARVGGKTYEEAEKLRNELLSYGNGTLFNDIVVLDNEINPLLENAKKLIVGFE